ncbi:uncharacterized protein LOC133173923 [Saccostrea echinata]|uniref:uncharacterized protein LOC133173923 n=1 Tax=Saccostrea echinata TaxID=191078 RepID=UPI002A7FD2DE|nr:uncharacterized protein LOC133173923 [Saccostrea echinata]
MVYFFIILSLAAVTVIGGKDVYCDIENNKFYVEQWGQCKDCDRCPKGYGLDVKEDVRISPVYGALSCRRCLKCVAGNTFKSRIGYGECVRCTNCTAVGKIVAKRCTIESDTVCTGTTPVVFQQQTISSENDNSVKHNNKEKTGSFDQVLTGIGAGILLFFVLISVFLIIKNRKRLPCCRNGPSSSDDIEEQNGLTAKNAGEYFRTIETEVESVPLKSIGSVEVSPVRERQHSVASEDMPSLDSNFHYRLNPYQDGEEIETDADQLPNPWLYEIPTDRELQRICPHIAHNNHFTRLGRELGVRDSEIQRIKEEQRNDSLEAAFQTLKKWREINGNLATKMVLQEALRRVELSHVHMTLVDDA